MAESESFTVIGADMSKNPLFSAPTANHIAAAKALFEDLEDVTSFLAPLVALQTAELFASCSEQQKSTLLYACQVVVALYESNMAECPQEYAEPTRKVNEAVISAAIESYSAAVEMAESMEEGLGMLSIVAGPDSMN